MLGPGLCPGPTLFRSPCPARRAGLCPTRWRKFTQTLFKLLEPYNLTFCKFEKNHSSKKQSATDKKKIIPSKSERDTCFLHPNQSVDKDQIEWVQSKRGKLFKKQSILTTIDEQCKILLSFWNSNFPACGYKEAAKKKPKIWWKNFKTGEKPKNAENFFFWIAFRENNLEKTL